MTSPRLRLTALVLFILSLAMFTGLATTVAALAHPEQVDACCDRGEPEQEPAKGPCTDAHCLCFSCLTLDLAKTLPLSRSLQIADADLTPWLAFCPDGFSAAIDYPPETA